MTELSLEQLEARINDLSAQISVLAKERENYRQQYAEMQTDLKVGDRVTYKGAKYVWQLTQICPGWGNTPKFFGAKIKKDGTPGAVDQEIWGIPYGKKLAKVADTSEGTKCD